MEVTQESVYSEIQKCPSCGSIYIEDDHCEACSLQFDFNKIGPPLGPRSFYTLKENYDKSLSFSDRFLFQGREKKEQYLRKILFRYRDLLELFYTQKNFGNRAYFFYELGDVVRELALFGFSRECLLLEFDNILTDKDSGTLIFEHLARSIAIGKKEFDQLWSKRFLRPMQARAFGGPKLLALFIFFSVSVFVVHLSLVIFPTLID